MSKIQVTCYTCGTKFLQYPSVAKKSKGRLFCSKECYTKTTVKGANNPNWQGGIPEKTCEVCGKKYKPFRRGKATTSRFCSQKCQNIGHSKELSGQNHPLWKGGKTPIQCKHCGRLFERWKSQESVYCSRKCAYLSRKILNSKKLIEKACTVCGKMFKLPLGKRKQIYCSKECFIKSSKEGRICKTCGKQFIANKSDDKEYCSYHCFGKSRTGDKNPRWEGGISYIPYCPKFNETLKEKIRERDGRKCQECRCTEERNKKKLSVHHIHYDKPNCNPDLIALCLRCNNKANSKKDYWERHYMEKLMKRGLLI